jgi:acyl-coenzyme A thioesterase PaaI-like protein
VALVNLAEATSGLAVITALPTGLRGIVTGLSIEYQKKARGRITAECRCPPIAAGPSRDLEVVVSLTDERADVVATAKVQWRVGPG